MSDELFFGAVKDAATRRSLEDLDQVAHSHTPQNSIPSDKDGSVGDIIPVSDGTNFYLYVKFESGWSKFTAA